MPEFAVAFAAALVLVDAARFLRDLFGEDEIVRRKLNESYELYGIAEGNFDDIQVSLTDPGNALKIREATEFYDQHDDAIRDAIQQNDQMHGILDAIDGRIERVRVGSGRYVKVAIRRAAAATQ